MAEEFQAGVCGDTWWNPSSRSAKSTGLSPCSLAHSNDVVSYGTWQTDSKVNFRVTRSCFEESDLVSSSSSMIFQDVHSSNLTVSGNISVDTPSQMMGHGLPSSTSSNWNPSLLGCTSGTNTETKTIVTKLDYRQEAGVRDPKIQKDWIIESFSSCADQVSSTNGFKPIDQEFSLDQLQGVSTVTSNGISTLSCQGLSSGTSGFPLASSNPYGYETKLIQRLFSDDPQQQDSIFNSQSSCYSSPTNYSKNSSSPTWTKFPSFLKASARNQQLSTGLLFSDNTPFWNASAAALTDIRDNLFNSSESQYSVSNGDRTCPTVATKPKDEEVLKEDGSILKKTTCSEPSFKRPRIESPSPLPTFKVRKEKLGDRITALQQLVSPFGKTDTASVLHEAIEYIKFLHDQVNVLSGPYKNVSPPKHQQGVENPDSEDSKQDLISRGLCLVPISSTFPVANKSPADFWTPTFGGTFR